MEKFALPESSLASPNRNEYSDFLKSFKDTFQLQSKICILTLFLGILVWQSLIIAALLHESIENGVYTCPILATQDNTSYKS